MPGRRRRRSDLAIVPFVPRSPSPSSLALIPADEQPLALAVADDTQPLAIAAAAADWSSRLRFPITKRQLKRDRRSAPRSLADHVAAWASGRVAAGASEDDCALPFLTHAPKAVECSLCGKCMYSKERVKCSVRDCRNVFHKPCAKKCSGRVNKAFKCPQHVCFICKKGQHWRCARCMIAAHTKCAPWPNDVIQLSHRHGQAVCWRHSIDWRLEEHPNPTSDVEEAFSRLPLPYVDEEFKINSILKDVIGNKAEPAPYIHIKRNLYLVKRKRDCPEADVGCTLCDSNSTCNDTCECRGLSVSCSRACHCSDKCTNRPFRKEKKLKVVKTVSCGWGVEALETLEMGAFVVEYLGEVIDDALCEQRLWDMKRKGDRNFYMCEVSKDFTIDATFKGNSSRFLNHSCDPNCQLEKWQVDGETRVGVFALRPIEAGEPLTYDYRFENFGPIEKCNCGASNCHGVFGSKKKTTDQKRWKEFSVWGCKRRRATMCRTSRFR